MRISGDRKFLIALFFLLRAICPAAANDAEKAIMPERVLSGHTDGVMSVSFLPDNERAVSGSHDGTIRLWNTSNGKPLHVFKGHAGPVWSVAVSGDGKFVASGSSDHTVRVWEISSGDQVAQLEGHTGDVRFVSYLPDGTLISGGGDGIRVWNVKTEKLIWNGADAFPVFAMAVSRDGRRCAASNHFDGTTDVWDLIARKRLGIRGHSPGWPYAVGLSADSRTLYAYALGDDEDAWFGRLDLATNRKTSLPEGATEPRALFMSADGRTAVTAGVPIIVWDTRTWTREQSFDPLFDIMPLERVNAVALSPDGKRLIAGAGGEENNETWKPGKRNYIAVYNVPAAIAPKAARTPQISTGGGRISWTVIPAMVKKKSGQTVPLKSYFVGLTATRTSKPVAIDKTTDLIVGYNSVLLHKTGGLLEDIYPANSQELSGGVWDGKSIWIASPVSGITVLDLSGKVLARAPLRSLPIKTHQAIELHAVAPGKVLAIGAAPQVEHVDPADSNRRIVDPWPDGWFAMLSQDTAKPSEVAMNVLVEDGKLPPGWDGRFVPLLITEPPSTAGKREILVEADDARDGHPILRLNPETLKISIFNKRPADPKLARRGGSLPEKLLWLTNRTAVQPGDPPTKLTLGEDRIDTAEERPIGLRHSTGFAAMLMHQGQIYCIGENWMKIDPATLAFEELGRGLTATDSTFNYETLYFDSATLGLTGLTEKTGSFYQFHVNTGGTAVAASTTGTGVPIPSNGFIEYEGDKVTFLCGDGGVTFDGAHAKMTRDSWHWRLPVTDHEENLGNLRARIVNSDLSQIGVKREQAQAVDLIARSDPRFKTEPDERLFMPLFETFRAAPQGPAQDKAAKAILDQVRIFTEHAGPIQKSQMDAIKAVFTDAQWKVISAGS